MRVGLVVEDIAPTDGGGYTFVRELLAALLPLQPATQHEFVVVHSNGGRPTTDLVSGASALDLDSQRATVMTFEEQLLGLMPARLRAAAARLKRSSATPRWDQRVYVREGIEFLVRLAPHG